MRGYPCKICGEFPVNSKLITCKSYIFFNAISTCVPKVRNYGDFRQHVIPTIITCMLRGTPCDTGFTRKFYRGNICSVGTISKNLHLKRFSYFVLTLLSNDSVFSQDDIYTANVSPIKVTGKPRVTGGTP